MTEADRIAAFADLAFPYATERLADLRSKSLKVAHYTSAENAAKILRNKTIWLRNAALMNDFSEVQHGGACLRHSLESSLGMRLQAVLDSVYPQLLTEVLEWLKEADFSAKHHTYLTSVSAHKADDKMGRLSMWRAYGGQTAGVALIFNTDGFQSEDDQLSAYSSPVLYGGLDIFYNEFEKIVSNIENNLQLMASIPRTNVKAIILNAFHYSILSTKHVAFEEEQEWRVIHSPLTNSSEFIRPSIECINGVPQIVYRFPLENQLGLSMPELDISNLLHRVIIGPCSHPVEVAWAFQEILRELKIPDPESRISLAEIPLRQRS